MNPDKAILGIHIEGDCLNIVHLGQTANGLEVLNWAAKPLETGIVEDGLITDAQIVSQKIHDFTKTNQIKTRKTVMSLPCSTVRLKPCEFPQQTDEQLKQQVEEQIGKYGLFGGQEIVFDYCKFDTKNPSSNKQMVLQAITTKQMSDTCMAVARKAGLELVRIEPVVLPMIKLAFNQQTEEDARAVSMLLAFDTTSSNLSVFNNGVPQICQNLGVGVKDLLQNTDGISRLTEQMESVLEFAHSLAGPQQLLLKVAVSRNHEKLGLITDQIRQILSEVNITQIENSQIAEQFDIQGVGWDGASIFAFSSALTSFGVCEYDGHLNLLSRQSLTLIKTQKEISLTAKAVVAVILFSIITLIPLKIKVKSVEADVNEMTTKVTDAIPIRDKINNLTAQVEQANIMLPAYIEVSKELKEIPWLEILDDIAQSLPSQVRIIGILPADSTDFILIGEALAESNVYKFAKRLQNTRSIDSAKVDEVKYDSNGKWTTVDYRIICKTTAIETNL